MLTIINLNSERGEIKQVVQEGVVIDMVDIGAFPVMKPWDLRKSCPELYRLPRTTAYCKLPEVIEDRGELAKSIIGK